MSKTGTLNSAEVKPKTASDPRALLVEQVRRWGGMTTDAILDPSCMFFSHPNIKGLIGYRIEANCAVVFGDPIAAASDKPRLAEAFAQFCNGHKLDIVYTIISPEFADTAIKESKGTLIQFGNTLILNPSDNPVNKTGSKAGLIRKKVKQAQKEKTEVCEYKDSDPSIEKAIEKIGIYWLQKRHGFQIYISHLNLFGDRLGKRWFYAKHDGQVVGFLLLNELKEKNGWLMNNLIMSAQAPNGTSELLITATLDILAKENCKQVLVGPVTAKDVEKIVGANWFSTWIIRLIFKISNKLFRLNGQTQFWDKFQAETEPSYIFFDRVNYRSIKALMCAMNVSLNK